MNPPTLNTSDSQPESIATIPQKQCNNPLHGITLETMVKALAAHFGWPELAERIPVRCFSNDPSISSSLKFLRKTPWARDKVESLYQLMLRDIYRANISQSDTVSQSGTE